MTRIFMIRHGEATASWDGDHDPGLSKQGIRQAGARAIQLNTDLSSTSICSSPLARCQQTAKPLAQIWNLQVNIEPRLAEIPSPSTDLKIRGDWLKRAMQKGWDCVDNDPARQHDYRQWRADIVACLHEWGRTNVAQVVMFTHFIAINVAYTHAASIHDRMIGFRPDHASCSIFESDGETLRLITRGDEASTTIM